MPNPHQPEEMPSLKPCPWCRTSHRLQYVWKRGHEAYHTMDLPKVEKVEHEIWCQNCGIAFRSGNSQEAVTESWNARPLEDALGKALEILAAFPLEACPSAFNRPDSPIYGFNDWKLTSDHVRAARAALEAWKVGR